jgi:hypothetical protein
MKRHYSDQKLSKRQISWVAAKAKSLINEDTEFKHECGGFGISSDYAYNNGKQISFMGFGRSRAIIRLNYSNGVKKLVVWIGCEMSNFGIDIESGKIISWNYNLA